MGYKVGINQRKNICEELKRLCTASEQGVQQRELWIVTTKVWKSKEKEYNEREHTLRNSVSGRVSFLGAECSSSANIVAGDSSWSQNLRIFVNWGAGNDVEFATDLRIKVEMRSEEEMVLSVRQNGMWSALMDVRSYIPNSSWSLL